MMLSAGIAALLGIAFATLVGFPVVPFYLAAGVVWGLGAFPWVMLALVVHLLLSFILARSMMRPLLIKILKKFSAKLDLEKLNQQNVHESRQQVILVRLIPGVPLCVKSYFLGICGARFFDYLFYSLLIEAFWVLGFILFGKAAVQGQWPLMLVGLLLVVLMGLISRRKASAKA